MTSLHCEDQVRLLPLANLGLLPLLTPPSAAVAALPLQPLGQWQFLQRSSHLGVLCLKYPPSLSLTLSPSLTHSDTIRINCFTMIPLKGGTEPRPSFILGTYHST